MKTTIHHLLGLACIVVAGSVQAQSDLTQWPDGYEPREIGVLVSNRFVEVPHPNFNGNPNPPNEITYPETCAWWGALRLAHVTGDTLLLRQLEERFLPIFGPERRLQPLPDHVDHTVFGVIPLQLYAQTGNPVYRSMGLWYADAQWSLPQHPSPKDKELLGQGLSWQTRYWIDDMFMISAIQSQAYLITREPHYIDRAAQEMLLYLKRLQRPNGLFWHAEDVPFFWSRGNGWMAAGMTELLSVLPTDHPTRPEILQAYKKMMATLARYQKDDGLWGQLIDDPEAWSESSGSAMFLYAFIKGVRKGWLDSDLYGPVVRKGWIGLVDLIDQKGDLAQVCEGTNKTNDRQFYLNRKTLPGNMHGQAPLLWCVTAFLE